MNSWGTLRAIPNVYNAETEEIDETILNLIQKRRAAAKGQRLTPDREKLEQWASRYGMEVPELATLVNAFNDQPYPMVWHEPGELTGVLSIMKKTVSGDCEYLLTHAMQYEDRSLVKLEIKYLPQDSQNVQIRPQLTLAVIGGGQYQINQHGGHGGGGRSQIEYIVVPALPDNLEGIDFSLVPGALHLEREMTVIKLDKQVDF